jgi:cytidine deaminase
MEFLLTYFKVFNGGKMILKANSVILVSFAELDPVMQELALGAEEASEEAHNPFGKRWSVGGCILIEVDGEIIFVKKANWEHPTMQLSTCAERRVIPAVDVALIPHAKAIAVFGKREQWPEHLVLLPCDACQPALRDFADHTLYGQEDFQILLVPPNFRRGGKIVMMSVSDLRYLPDFTPDGTDPETLVETE